MLVVVFNLHPFTRGLILVFHRCPCSQDSVMDSAWFSAPHQPVKNWPRVTLGLGAPVLAEDCDPGSCMWIRRMQVAAVSLAVSYGSRTEATMFKCCSNDQKKGICMDDSEGSD